MGNDATDWNEINCEEVLGRFTRRTRDLGGERKLTEETSEGKRLIKRGE